MRRIFVIGLLGFVTSSFSYAGVFSILDAERLGPQENCGSQPPRPNLMDKAMNTEVKQADDAYFACMQRNEQRKILANENQQEKLVFDVTNSCQNAVRKLSSSPQTLVFESNTPNPAKGLSGANIETTDAGYSVKVFGKDGGSRFFVTCYLDRGLRVLQVR